MIWRGRAPVAGSAEAVERLRNSGNRVVFVTNSALRTRRQVAEKLAEHGIADAEPDVMTSAMAAATLVEPGERVLACGGDGLLDELGRAGAEIVTSGPADAVVVGISADFDYQTLTTAMRTVRAGARLIATNDDPTFPAEDGLLPGNGALVASIERASETEAVVAGKPNPPIVDLVRRHCGEHGIVVGDRPDTDGLLAARLGYSFALVLSGVTSRTDLPVLPEPDMIADDLAGIVAMT